MVKKIQNEIQDGKNIFWMLALGVLFSLGLYAYLLSHTVYTAVLRQQTEKSISTLEHGAEDLESRYIGLKKTVTTDIAKAKGFKPIATTVYISRGTTGKLLSLVSKP